MSIALKVPEAIAQTAPTVTAPGALAPGAVVAAPTVPVATVTQEEINTWYALQEQVEVTKEKEMALRKKIAAALFPKPVEGTNTLPLSEGWVMKMKHTINRKVDVPLLTTLAASLTAQGIPIDSLIRYKPDVDTTEYRKLTAEQRVLFEQVLDIKEGTPALEIMLPKRK